MDFDESSHQTCIECEIRSVHRHGSHYCMSCATLYYQNVGDGECISCREDIEPIHRTGKLTCSNC